MEVIAPPNPFALARMNIPVYGDAAGSSDVVLSSPTTTDLVVYRGDSGSLRIAVTDAEGEPLDVTQAVWDCDVRAKADDEKPLTSLTVELDPDDTSAVIVRLSSAQSALLTTTCVWDLQMTLGGEVVTLVTGAIKLTKDVSR